MSSCPAVLSTVLIVLFLSGCGEPRLAYAPTDMRFGIPIMSLTAKETADPEARLLEAVGVAGSQGVATAQNAARIARDGYLAASANGAGLSINDRAALAYNLSLAQYLLGDLAAAAESADMARGLQPSSNHISALQFRIMRVQYQQTTMTQIKNIEQSAARIEDLIGKSTNQTVAVVETLSGQLKETAERSSHQLSDIATGISQQTSVLDRAIGTYVPIKLPANLEEYLTSLEAIVENEKLWPTTEVTAREFASAVAACARSIPPWAESDLLPRFTSLRWHVAAFHILADSSRMAPEEAVSAYDAVLLAAYPGAPQGMRNRLLELRSIAEGDQADKHEKRVLAAATSAINDGENTEEAYTGLDYLVERKHAEATKLQQALRTRMTNAVADNALSGLDSRYNLMKKFQPDIRLQALRQLAAQASSLRLAWVEQGVDQILQTRLLTLSKSADKDLESLAKNDQHRRWSAYQLFALDRIEKIKNYMTAMENKKAGFSVNNPDRIAAEGVLNSAGTSADGATYGHGISRYLLDVDPNILDTAVSSLFQAQWNKIWNLAENKEQIAREAATTPKKGLYDMP